MANNAGKRQRILVHLENGLTFKDACIAAGSSERSGHRWKSEDDSFGSQVEASIVKYIEKLVRCVNAQAAKDGMFALKVLQIRFPEEWNPARKVQTVDTQAEFNRIKELISERRNMTSH